MTAFIVSAASDVGRTGWYVVARIVIVGAGLSGLRTVEELRRAGFEGELTLAGGETHLPYDRPPLSKEVIRGDKDETTLRPAEFYVENKVDLKLGSPATSVDTVAKSVAFADGSTLDYDELVIATGLTPRRIAGLPELSGVHVLRSIEEALALRADLAPGKRALIVGGRLHRLRTGREHEVSRRRRRVCSNPSRRRWRRCSAPPSAPSSNVLHRNEGIDVRVGTGLTSLSGDGAVAAATLSDGSEIPVDVVAIGVGSVPVTGWLDGSGIELDNGVLCDGVGRTSAEHVWAVGDVASWQIGDRRKRVEHWTNAGDQAKILAGAITGTGDPDAPAQVPYFWSDQYDVKIQALVDRRSYGHRSHRQGRRPKVRRLLRARRCAGSCRRWR